MIIERRDRLDIIWVTDYYDEPLEGLCRWEGKLAKFENWWGIGTHRPQHHQWVDTYYRITSLSFWQKVNWLIHKKLFELFVARNWSYSKGSRGPYLRVGVFGHTVYYNWVARMLPPLGPRYD